MADPAPGAELSITVPANEIWVIQNAFFRFNADITVADRFIEVIYDDGNDILFRSMAGRLVQANENVRFSLYPEADLTVIASVPIYVTYALPRRVLFPGWRFRTTTLNVQAGDDYSEAFLGITRWPDRSPSAQVAQELKETLLEELDLEAVTEAMLSRR